MKYNIPLKRIPLEEGGCHLLLEARWADRLLVLVLDTGASKTVFDLAEVRSLHPDLVIEVSEQKSAGLGTDTMESHLFKLKDFYIGKCQIRKVKAAALDISHIQSTYQALGFDRLDGILGGDILMKYKAKINYRKLLLQLHDEK